ncbi:MAG: glycosyltransferase family 2 protein, partial [Actinomycetota bacterium]
RCEIIVIDNGSKDGSVEMLRSSFPNIRLIENSENLGFPKAVNQGLSISTGRYLALLNPDVMTTKNSLAEMVKFLSGHPEAAAVGPQLIGRSGHMQYCGGYAPSPMAAFRQFVELQALRGGRSRGVMVRSRFSNRPQSVDWLCGGSLILNRKAVDSVGMMDESRFLYADDVDYGIRMRKAGWKLYLLPWIRIVHYGGASVAGFEEVKLLWLGGIFRIAANNLSRTAYFFFSIFMAASFMSRYLLVGLLRAMPRGSGLLNKEVSSTKEMLLYAKTSFKFAMSHPKYAMTLCTDLEKSFRKSAAEV